MRRKLSLNGAGEAARLGTNGRHCGQDFNIVNNIDNWKLYEKFNYIYMDDALHPIFTLFSSNNGVHKKW